MDGRRLAALYLTIPLPYLRFVCFYLLSSFLRCCHSHPQFPLANVATTSIPPPIASSLALHLQPRRLFFASLFPYPSTLLPADRPTQPIHPFPFLPVSSSRIPHRVFITPTLSFSLFRFLTISLLRPFDPLFILLTLPALALSLTLVTQHILPKLQSSLLSFLLS